jgi:ubiquinone/menaquinone biosynthesis C-methylase UbiE
MKSRKRKNPDGLIEEIRAHVKTTFEQIAADFDGTRYKPWPETVDYLKSIPDGSKLLDLGSGNGRNAVFAAKNGYDVVGVDIAASMVSIAELKLRELGGGSNSGTGLGRGEFIQADLENLPLQSNSFRAAICVATLHHVPSGEGRLEVVTELHRVLEPGATALVSVWDLDQERFKHELMRQLYSVCCRSPETSGAEAKSEKGGRRTHPQPYEFGDVWVPWQSRSGETHYRFYHLFYHNELVQLLENCGFKIIKYFKRADNHNAVVQKRNPKAS